MKLLYYYNLVIEKKFDTDSGLTIRRYLYALLTTLESEKCLSFFEYLKFLGESYKNSPFIEITLEIIISQISKDINENCSSDYYIFFSKGVKKVYFDDKTKHLLKKIVTSNVYIEALGETIGACIEFKGIIIETKNVEKDFNNVIENIYSAYLSTNQSGLTTGGKKVYINRSKIDTTLFEKINLEILNCILNFGGFLIIFSHEFTHVETKSISNEYSNIYNRSPYYKSFNMDSGDYLENQLYGSKLSSVGKKLCEFLLNLENWNSVSLKISERKFKSCIIQII